MAGVKSVARWGGILLGALAAAVLIGAGVVFFLITRLDVRAEVERAVESATGRQLVIAGDVGVSFYPVLGLRAEDATLANVEGGRAPALAAMEEINVGVEIWPLFRREVIVRKLALQHPNIALEIDAQGRPNWLLRPTSTAPAPEGSPTRPTNFTLSEILITDGEVSFFDGRRNVGWVISDADLRTAFNGLDAPLNLAGTIRYGDKPVELDTTLANPRAAMAGQASAVVTTIQSELLMANFDGNVARTGEMDGTIRASGPSLRQLSAWVGAPLQGGVVGLEAFAVSGRITAGQGRMAFANAGFALDHLRGRGDFELSTLRDKPYLSGRLELFDFDLNPYLTGQMPPQVTGDAAAPPPAAPAEGVAAATAEIAVVEAPARAIDVQAEASETPIDLSGLNAINADLQITTHALLIQRMRIDAASLGFVVNDGRLAATLHNIQLYGGSGRGELMIDASAPATKISQSFRFDGVDANRFLTDAVNLGTLEGRAELTLRLHLEGRTQSEMIASADGSGHIEVVSGAVRGVDLGGVSRTIRNAVRGELVSPAARTPFNGLSATIAVADGVIASDTLSFNTPDLRIPGVGVYDLNQNRLDLRIAPRAQRGGVAFPVTIRGPIGALAYDSDLRDRFKPVIEARVREVVAAARRNEAAAR